MEMKNFFGRISSNRCYQSLTSAALILISVGFIYVASNFKNLSYSRMYIECLFSVNYFFFQLRNHLKRFKIRQNCKILFALIKVFMLYVSINIEVKKNEIHVFWVSLILYHFPPLHPWLCKNKKKDKKQRTRPFMCIFLMMGLRMTKKLKW